MNARAKSGSGRVQNVGTAERAASLLGGGWLAWRGLRKGGLAGVAAAVAGAALVRRGATGHCELKQRLGIGPSGGAAPEDYFKHGIHVEESVTVQAPAAQVFAFWRNFENLARFMRHIKAVTVLDEGRSHWVVEGPTGDVEWDAEIINEEPDRLIAWRSLPGAEVDNTGTVQFREAPGGRGTEVRVTLEYLPPAGKVGLAIAKVMGKTPGIEVREDLRRLRQLLETGEVPTTEGQPRGQGRSAGTFKTEAYAKTDVGADTGRYGRDRGAEDASEERGRAASRERAGEPSAPTGGPVGMGEGGRP